MKIGILTFHAAHNYGSMLQAYALQRFLKDHGHEPEFINFRSKVQKLMYAHPFDFRYKYMVKETVYNALHHPQTLWPRYMRWEKHEKFIKQHLSLSQEYNTEEEIKQCADNYDLIIVGSDQIWNTNALDFSTVYFADFSNTKKYPTLHHSVVRLKDVTKCYLRNTYHYSVLYLLGKNDLKTS